VRNVLEAGCGNGLLTARLAKLGIKISAVDFSEGMLREAKKRASGRNVRFFRADLRRLPFRNDSFDLVILSNVLINQDDRNAERIISECCRVLRRDGFLILNFENRGTMLSLAFWLGRSRELFARTYPPGFIREILRRDSLKIVRERRIGFSGREKCPMIIKKEEGVGEKIRRIFSSWKSFANTSKYLIRVLLVKLSIRTGEKPATILVARKEP
jgi:ubiquinone/menaquinone biosynthesis C-methylase UbiE